MDAEIILVPDPTTVASMAAQRFANLARESVTSRSRFSVALSGGSTPETLYRLLADEPYSEEIPWHGVHLFWGDERCVPPDHPESNYRLVYETLIAHVPLSWENIHRIRGEREPQAAARAYERELRDFFCGPRSRFDLVLLGLGNDGHTASLFPDSDALGETDRLAAVAQANYQDRPVHRVTLTMAAINTARQVLFLVTGRAKAPIVQAVLEGPGGRFPAQRIRPTAGQLTWLVDAEAAEQLERLP
jgi:6-phosphogluconolactonase